MTTTVTTTTTTKTTTRDLATKPISMAERAPLCYLVALVTYTNGSSATCGSCKGGSRGNGRVFKASLNAALKLKVAPPTL